MSRWNYEYAPKFNKKIVHLKNPLAAHRIRRLCEWIAEQKDPNDIPHCKSCAEQANKKLYFPTYGWHIIFRFEDGIVVFVMFYNASDDMIQS